LRRPWVGFPLGWARPVLSSQRSAVMIFAGLVIPVVHQRPGDERHGT
jgi:hypothetical protein